VTGHENDDLADWDAAYLLGALSDDEQREYENYLAADPARGAELAELQDITKMFDVLSPEEALALLAEPTGQAAPTAPAAPVEPAAPVDAPSAPVVSFAQAADKRRRRTTRWATALAAAAALLIIGGVVGYNAIPTQAPGEPQVSMQAMAAGQRPGVTAALAVTHKQWGTRLDWHCEYTKDWAKDVDSYDLVVTTVDGKESTVASWSPVGDEAGGLAASTVIPTDQIRSVDIREAGTKTPLAVTTLT
jgi:hypothetical protein